MLKELPVSDPRPHDGRPQLMLDHHMANIHVQETGSLILGLLIHAIRGKSRN